jgi:molybdopterin biosynthesis enzyme MoaB
LAVQLLESNAAATDAQQKTAFGETFRVVYYGLVPDDRSVIAERIRQLSGQKEKDKVEERGSLAEIESVQLIITTGGTGIAARDVTPEATSEACEGRSIWGLSFLMLQISLKYTPLAALSRYGAGVCGATLVVNLPGKPRAVREILPEIKPVLAHGCALLSGSTRHESDQRDKAPSEKHVSSA